MVTLPALKASTDSESCVPNPTTSLTPLEAKFSCWMESCFVCASSGSQDTMLFCVDCGEAFHSFCTQSPIFSMDADAVSGWR